MHDSLPDILATRLNRDVVSFRGNTRREMIAISFISLTCCVLVLGLLAKCFLGMFLIGLGLSFPVAIPVGWVIATVLQRVKADKPKGYVTQQLRLWADRKGIVTSPFIRYSGAWSVRRIADVNH